MKPLFITIYLIAGLLLAGADIQIITPNGTTFGHIYPDGNFILRGPGQAQSEGRLSPNESILPGIPNVLPDLHPGLPSLHDNTYGYREGNSYTIITPGGTSFGYITPE